MDIIKVSSPCGTEDLSAIQIEKPDTTAAFQQRTGNQRLYPTLLQKVATHLRLIIKPDRGNTYNNASPCLISELQQ